VQNTEAGVGQVFEKHAVLDPQEVPGFQSLLAWSRANLSLSDLDAGAGSDLEIQRILRDAELRTQEKLQRLKGAARELGSCGNSRDYSSSRGAGHQIPPTSDEVAHDAYFCVERVHGDVFAIFLRSIIAARMTLLDEAIPGAETSHVAIDHALCDLLRAACGPNSPLSIPVDVWTPKPRGAPMKRWIKGHQIFAVLTQGLIFAFKNLGHAIRSGDSQDQNDWAEICISLFKGSAAAFEFTGAFGIDEYNASIRPTMMCPAAPVNLSGLMSSDHRHLVQQMRNMRPALKAMSQTHPEKHKQLAESLAAVYDSHIHVCDRFVGVQPSLLTAGTTEKSGPALVAQFKSVRLKAFEHVARAERLVHEPEPQPAGRHVPQA
jgi:hypothetical protein